MVTFNKTVCAFNGGRKRKRQNNWERDAKKCGHVILGAPGALDWRIVGITQSVL